MIMLMQPSQPGTPVDKVQKQKLTARTLVQGHSRRQREQFIGSSRQASEVRSPRVKESDPGLKFQ